MAVKLENGEMNFEQYKLIFNRFREAGYSMKQAKELADIEANRILAGGEYDLYHNGEFHSVSLVDVSNTIQDMLDLVGEINGQLVNFYGGKIEMEPREWHSLKSRARKISDKLMGKKG